MHESCDGIRSGGLESRKLGRSHWPHGLRPKVCGRPPAEIVGSNPTGGMDVCLVSVVFCQVEVSATS